MIKAVDALSSSEVDRYRLNYYHTRLGKILEQINIISGRHLTPFEAGELARAVESVRRELTFAIDTANDSTVTAILRPIQQVIPLLGEAARDSKSTVKLFDRRLTGI